MRLSEIEALPSFALLGPGWGAGGQLLVAPLEETTSAPVLRYRSFESDRSTAWSGPARVLPALETDVSPAALSPAFDEERYAAGVRTIREAIAAGDVYQVNLTTRVPLGSVSGAALWATLTRRGMPRFAAWVRAPGVEFVSASPELLFEVNGRDVRAEPMKGTAPAGQKAWLEASTKDEAELAMITDLMRNDLTPVCEPRSVDVRHERRFIDLPYAVQAVSDVVGRLREGVGPEALLEALHPGGSVTGAPKRAACDLIAALEEGPRGAYCGSLVYTAEGRSIASLLIRTAFRTGDSFVYGVGAGITWDSVPTSEVAEVRTKLGALT
jgi:anthranilate/para-aminobenzoate synthase component I